MIRKISGCMAAGMMLFSGSSGAGAIGTYGTTRAFDKFMATSTGTGAQTIKFSGSGVPLASAPTAGAVTLGNAGVVADSASGGLIVSGTASLPLNAAGLVAPVAMSGFVSAGTLATAVGALASFATNPYLAIALVATPFIYDWLTRSGVSILPDGGFMLTKKSNVCEVNYPSASNLKATLDGYGYGNIYQWRDYAMPSPGCAVDLWIQVGGSYWNGPYQRIIGTQKVTGTTAPADLPTVIAAISTVQPDPGVLKELFTIDQTGTYSDQTLKDLAITNVVAHGPSTVSGPSTLTSTAATPTASATQTTTKTDYNCVYVMADVTCNKTDTTSVQPVGIDPSTNLPYPKTPTTTTTTDTPPVDAASDTPLPGAPKLYTPKYPDGLVGVWNTQSVTLKNSPLLHLLPSLMPNIGAASGYPSFPITVEMLGTNFGTYDVSPASYVWDFLKWCVLICTAFLVRALIFGG